MNDLKLHTKKSWIQILNFFSLINSLSYFICKSFIYIYIYIMVIWIKLAIKSTVASFSRKSIVMSTFMSQKIINITFFTDCCAQNFFSTKAHSGKLIFSLFVNIFFWLKLAFPTHHEFISKFHLVCTSQPPKIWWQTSVQVWSTLSDLLLLWIACKIQIIFAIN